MKQWGSMGIKRWIAVGAAGIALLGSGLFGSTQTAEAATQVGTVNYIPGYGIAM